MRVKTEYRMASKESFEVFKLKHPEIKLSFTEWQNIIYTFNYKFRDYLLETGDKAKLPWGFGNFAISKSKPRKFKKLPNGKEVVNLPIDWKKTREFGEKMYHFNAHTDGYKFKWKWFIPSARFQISEIWTFKPYRITSRLLKHYLTKEDYKNKYLEWIK